MKKNYERPVLRTAAVVFGVFGDYGCDNGGGIDDHREGWHERHQHHRWWWWR